MSREPSVELVPSTRSQHRETGALNDREKKPVKCRPSKTPQSLVATVYAKQLAMSKRSILAKQTPRTPGSVYKRNTLLDQPVPNVMELKAWKHTDEFTKLAAAAAPLHAMAKARSWELKTFNLVLNKNLNDRLDNGDSTALEYIRDQLTRLIRRTVDPRAEFLYGIEKAPEALAENSSRRLWHLHGLMIGPVGFSKPGKTALRMKLRAIKGDADSDLMFKTPGERIGADPQAAARQWCVYAVKNGLTVEVNPLLAARYELPAGKPTFISSVLRRETKRWHAGKLKGLLVSELIAGAPNSIY